MKRKNLAPRVTAVLFLLLLGFLTVDNLGILLNTAKGYLHREISFAGVMRQITEGYRKGEFDAVKLCYTRFDSMMTQTAATMEVLPLSIEPTEQQKAEARRSQILYKPSSEEVFSAIIPEYVAGVVYGAVCESVASELAARRTAMDAATKNAGEMIDHLNLYYNRARQAAITQEITEIVAGAEN